ncbi:MAG TPA: hypothetical protein VLG49_01965 [Rhabdochlamydiaceae bacterium]|nr:hypothetical protein [Rhabdochlamydiaceae bacterium]
MRVDEENYKKYEELFSEELTNRKNVEIKEVKKTELKKNKFEKILNTVIDENDDVLRRLADK